MVAFVKVDLTSFIQAVTMGEISGNILMDLGVMADEVIGPLLCNPENQKGWPKIVQNDMRRHVIELRNLMHQVSDVYLLKVYNFPPNYTKACQRCAMQKKMSVVYLCERLSL